MAEDSSRLVSGQHLVGHIGSASPTRKSRGVTANVGDPDARKHSASTSSSVGVCRIGTTGGCNQGSRCLRGGVIPLQRADAGLVRKDAEETISGDATGANSSEADSPPKEVQIESSAPQIRRFSRNQCFLHGMSCSAACLAYKELGDCEVLHMLRKFLRLTERFVANSTLPGSKV